MVQEIENGKLSIYPPSNVRQPLHRQRRPFQSMSNDQIIQEWGILFPYFVFFVDEFFFGYHLVFFAGARG